jgi:hypothetical protein
MDWFNEGMPVNTHTHHNQNNKKQQHHKRLAYLICFLPFEHHPSTVDRLLHLCLNKER